jgi:hypothetical protein
MTTLSLLFIIRESEQKRPPEEPQNNSDDHRPRIPDELSLAFRNGDEDRALAILKTNPALVHAHRDGVTPLHAAAALLLERWLSGSWIMARA